MLLLLSKATHLFNYISITPVLLMHEYGGVDKARYTLFTVCALRTEAGFVKVRFRDFVTLALLSLRECTFFAVTRLVFTSVHCISLFFRYFIKFDRCCGEDNDALCVLVDDMCGVRSDLIRPGRCGFVVVVVITASFPAPLYYLSTRTRSLLLLSLLFSSFLTNFLFFILILHLLLLLLLLLAPC